MQCALKELVEEHWGESDPRNPVPATGPLARIADIAFNNAGFFKDDVADNVVAFQLWLREYMNADNSSSRALPAEAP